MKEIHKQCTFFALLLSGLFVISSCASGEKMVASGNYDQGISYALRKLKKSKKKDKDVLLLERAFKKATQRDMDKIVFLKKEGQPENWEEINLISQQIATRQEKIKPILPVNVVSEGNRKAEFTFVNVDELILESKAKAAEFLYQSGMQLLISARSGDKLAAKQAYGQFDKIGNYYNQYKDHDKLKAEAREIGINKVLFRMVNNSFTILPLSFEYDLARIDFYDLRDDWIYVYTDEEDATNFDYEIILNLRDALVGPNAEETRSYVDRRREQTGVDYRRDASGNFILDSLGNRIEYPVFTDFRANIQENRRFKEAVISGMLEFYNLKSGDRMTYNEQITARAVFENVTATYSGDQEALSSESVSLLNNRLDPFPTDRDMLLLVSEALEPLILDKTWDNRRYLNR